MARGLDPLEGQVAEGPTGLRLVVLGLVLALSVPVTPLEAPPGIIFSIVLASVTAVAVALWRPFWGAVLL